VVITNGTQAWEGNMVDISYPVVIKSKAVPLHAMEAHRGSGGIVPAHTKPRQ
jgi:hypothetical protein